MSKESLIASLRTVADYPKPGIKFWDVTTLFKNPVALLNFAIPSFQS